MLMSLASTVMLTLESGGACRPVTQEQKDADEKAEEKQTTVHLAHVKKGLAQLKVRPGLSRLASC